MLEHNYLYKNSTTLKNKYGIKNPQKFYERCTHNADRAAVNFRYEPLPQRFDAAYLKLIHWNLFHESFEWAGQTRDITFTFEDGSTARMPAIRPKGYEVPFAIGSQIQKDLKKLEKILLEKNNLRGLSRKEFAENATEVFMLLDHAHPFRKGNGRTQRMFMEKLGQAAGHPIDFSFITKERLTHASIEAMQHGNSEPMQHLFEDVTHPQKSLVLKEFVSQMKHSGLEEINNCMVIAAKEGVSYDGIYRDCAAEGFVIEVGDIFVVAHKDDLPPEYVKELRNGDYLSFQKSNVQNLQEILIPAEKLAPLTEGELCEKIANNPYVKACRKEIEQLSKTVYGNRKILSMKMDMIDANPGLGRVFANQIAQNPESVCKLAGMKIFCLNSPERRRAKQAVPQLSKMIKNYVIVTQQTKEEILEQHQREQNRLGKSVKKPGKELQNLFSLPPQKQTDVLSRSTTLQRQLHIFWRQLQNRLSSEDHKAIKENNCTKLSRLLGISESKAKEISQTVQRMKVAQYQTRSFRVNRIPSMSFSN
ncbi:BID domain-containing T4SS effector [Bartonella phoceensis]|uniref:BID domain-containing T4SS effector n=1 Tax=Bartonella phoceensis TaxID=270249 RepID=UPI001ABBB008|nr:BID domain-containing T4SS effector [Bartonella phoceensis]